MGGKVHACKEGRKWWQPSLGTIYSLTSKEWIKYIEMLNESHALHKTSLDIENMLLLINKKNVDSSGQSQWSILFTKHFISLPCRQRIYSLRGKGRDVHTRSKIKTLFSQKYFILDLPPFSGFPSAFERYLKSESKSWNCILLISVFLLPFGEPGIQWVPINVCWIQWVTSIIQTVVHTGVGILANEKS